MSHTVKEMLFKKISNLDRNSKACAHAKKHGLDVMRMTWEDTARTKGSCWGPNISDMTLKQNGVCMPVTRPPNFSDITMDVPINKIRILVGNHAGKALEYVTLDVFLRDIRKYVTDPDSFKLLGEEDRSKGWKCPFCEQKGNMGGQCGACMARRPANVGFIPPSDIPRKPQSFLDPEKDDEMAILSAQSCFLAMHEQEDVEFNVSLYNYQSSRENPKVLVITACAQGTSVTLCENGTTELLFNANGDTRMVVAKSLSAHRGVEKTDLETKMDNEEKALNSFIVIQVPLINNYKPVIENGFLFGGPRSSGLKKGFTTRPSDGDDTSFSASTTPSFSFGMCKGGGPSEPRHTPKEFSDIEHAILGVHPKSLGKFKEGNPNVAIARDTKYPIRITCQYYKVMRTDDFTERHFEIIKNQFAEAEALANTTGSLVIEGNTGRETEWMQVDEGAMCEEEK